MNITEFLRRILPASGLYVIARLTNKGFRHQVCESIEEAAMYALQFDASGVPTYHACAAYREREVETVKPEGQVWRQVRVHKNVRSLRAFWMDLDVEAGNEKKFESQAAAIEGLVDFCTATNLPLPMIVSSGNGVHCYWTLTDEIIPEAWRPVAEGLKALAAHYKFKADPAVTSDSARVLRPVGTYNRKVAADPRVVELVADSTSTISFADFSAHCIQALRSSDIKPPAESVRQVESPTETINQQFAVQHNFPPCSGHKVAERCAQLRVVRDTRGNVPEPHWYAAIQILCHSVEGDPLIHEWSKGYAGYSEGETNQKIAQVRSQSLGPTLCTTFRDRAPGGCDGCPFADKISSPAQLGTHVPSAPAPVVQTIVAEQIVEVKLPLPPEPFTRGEHGGIYIEEEGITHKIYEYDCYPIEIAHDEALGYETARLRHWLPQEGWKECLVRSALLARPVEFESALRDNSIQPLIRNKMTMYADAYIRKLKTDTKMRRLFKAQGWKNDDTEFVLGDKLYSKDTIAQAGFSHGLTDFLAPFHSKGSLDQWRTLTSAFEHPGFEPHAFMLLIAFAAPLLKLAGREGFTVSALGESGIGKSTMAQFMSSVYSHPKAAWIDRKDTPLARVQRFGAHFALPVYMDESTTMSNKELRDLVYSIPTGKSRSSMTADYKLRQGAEWVTIFVTSTNESLQAKLEQEKANPEAEALRLFEFQFPPNKDFGPIAKMIPAVIAENYGVAGAAYIQRLVRERDQVKRRLATIVAEAEEDFGMEDKERFWSQAVALTLYGGELARQWGVIEFNPARLRPWLLKQTQRMRRNMADGVIGPVAMLGDYLNRFIGERLVVTKLNAGMTAETLKPMREISSRYEKDTETLYISREHIKRDMDEHHFNFNELVESLVASGIVVAARALKTLGAGTMFTGGSVPCLKLRADHPELGLAL